MGCIDYVKAFDSVEHKDLFAALRKVGINEGYVQLLEDIYTNATARIHIENDILNIIRIERGVHQGDTLSPKVFTTAMEEIFRKLNLQERGVNVDGERLTDLRFADNVALITTSVKVMEVHLNNLNIESKKIGLKIHKGKTKYMTSYQSDETIMVEKEEIDIRWTGIIPWSNIMLGNTPEKKF
ncbi:hypothetical protein BSL78_21886 [Apostichopus japonicus]|uniref:Reverse transcriptase domain-containing protein n=1 Tax=Stichopus japonicus TaxID=307972 RepID=A0A2G8JZR0_STIJA|nr:hypothetical protein BSL78_21886 [Apostichopus japonicus]